MVSACHAFAGGPTVYHVDARPGQRRAGKKSPDARILSWQPESVQDPTRTALWLIPFSVPEVLRLVWSLVWQHAVAHAHIVAWSFFRRYHQAVAKASHYKRRLAATKT